MKALSIRQPWAWLIVNGYKTVENRSWSTSFRGDILIHAAKAPALKPEGLKILRESFKEEFGFDMPDHLPTGGAVGSANLIDCTLKPRDRHDRQWHEKGMYAFILRDAVELPFMPLEGKLNLFEIPDDILEHFYQPQQ